MYDHTLLQLIDNYFLPKSYRGAPDFIQEFHDHVLPLMKELRITKNLVLYTQHSIPTNIFFLLSGVAYSVMEYPYRSMPVAPFLWPAPAVIGDGKSYYKRKAARFGAAIQGFAKVYALERKHLQLIEDKFPKVQPHIRLAIKQQQQEFKVWKEELSNQKAPARLQHLLAQQPSLIQHVQQKYIAAHLGIYEPYSSKLIKEYKASHRSALA